ncbi:MAG: hypothetical protein AB7N65_03155 [Vicinamibacterales bacterium]
MNYNTAQHSSREPVITTAVVRAAEPVAYRDLPRDRLADEIEKISVDGRPAYPQLGPRRIRRVIMAAVGVILITGGLVALLVDGAMGLGMMAFGVLLFLMNPELWATVFRVRERRRAQRQVERATLRGRAGRRWRPNGHAPQTRLRTDVLAPQPPPGPPGSGEDTIDAFLRWNA